MGDEGLPVAALMLDWVTNVENDTTAPAFPGHASAQIAAAARTYQYTPGTGLIERRGA
jgi:hypothetical protein